MTDIDVTEIRIILEDLTEEQLINILETWSYLIFTFFIFLLIYSTTIFTYFII